MLIRYFSIEKEEYFACNEEYLGDSNHNIIPRIGEKMYIDSTAYKVYDICYSAEYVTQKTITTTIIDITLLLDED